MADENREIAHGSEKRGILNHLLGDLPGVTYRCRDDEDWTMLGLTSDVVDLTGWSVDDLVGHEGPSWNDLLHPDDRDDVRRQIRRRVDVGEPFQLVYRIRTRSGEERWILEQGRAVETDEGRILTGYLQDITGPLADRFRRTEDDLRSALREQRYLRLLQVVTETANRERSLEDALAAVLPEICRALSFRLGHVFLHTDEAGLRATGRWHIEGDEDEVASFVEATAGPHWRPADGLPGRVAQGSRARWVTDVKGDPEFLRVGPDDPSPLRSGVAAPILSQERILAVLEFYADHERLPEHGVVRLLEQVGIHLGRVWEREEAERAERHSRQLFRQLAERGEIVFWVGDTEGEIEYLSPGFQRVLGRDPDGDWTLERATDLLEIAYPEDRIRLAELLERGDRVPSEADYRILTHEGEVRWLHQRTFPLVDEAGEVVQVGGLAEDVTEARQSSVRLSATTRLLEQTFSSLDEAVIVIDTSGEGRGILRVNEAVERIFGWTEDELVGATTERLHVDRESFERFGDEGDPILEENGVFRATYPMARRDGTVFDAEQVVTLLDPDEGLSGGAVSVVRDVSQRTALERQLIQAQKMEAMGSLAGGIAHDFNNLLTVIRGQADVLLMDLDPGSPMAEEIAVVRDTADRAAQLTAQLLAFGREQVLRPRVVSLNEVVRDMNSLLHRALGEEIELHVHLCDEDPAIRVDPNQLEQVIMNLALNARDAMPEGGRLTLLTRLEASGVGASEGQPDGASGDMAELVVSDTGKGMDEETRIQIFEPFFTTRGESGGTGLGLSTSYGIVRQSGGTIAVESEPGEGTTFTICLPLAGQPPGETSRKPSSGAADPEGATLSGCRVLVVEDDASVRRVARRILERAGVEVRMAEDTESGLRALHSSGDEIDLLLTDLVLPGEGGRSLVDYCLEELPALPVVVMSGYAAGSPGSRRDLPAEVGFITKPFTPKGLVGAVREKLTAPAP